MTAAAVATPLTSDAEWSTREWTTIGSMDFDNRSLALNDEAALTVRDQGIGEQIDKIFLDDLRYSEEITAVTFRRRSWFQRLAKRHRT